jgi:hypothetical protein
MHEAFEVHVAEGVGFTTSVAAHQDDGVDAVARELRNQRRQLLVGQWPR